MKSPKRPAWTSSVVSGLRRLFAPLAGSGRSLFGVAAVLLLLVIGGYIGWAKWGGQISSQRRYSLSAESFEITPQPPWIHSDIKADVVRDGSLADLSILDPDLTKRVVQAFELNTWVAEALWAGKRSGKTTPQVVVKLRYREPVIMVRTRDPRWKGDCFWPVDTEGVFLPPDDFSASQTRTYLRVEAGNSLPAGAVGTAYGDPGVSGAAKIATGLRGNWQPMGLEWIVVRKEMPQEVGQAVEPTFILLPAGVPNDVIAGSGSARFASAAASTRGALEVRWGHAPGREPEGEATAAEKVARLQQFVDQNGRLDQLPPTTIVDLRPTAAISVISEADSLQPISPR